MPRDSMPTVGANQVRLRALRMLADGMDIAAVATRLHRSVKQIRMWRDADIEQRSKSKTDATPAPYRTGYAGWGRWGR